MTQLSGFMEEGKKHKLCKLLKFLYRLKHALNAHCGKFDSYFKDQHLNHSDVDHNLYYLKSNDKIVVLILYVDDLLLNKGHEEKINWLKEQLKARFEMTYLSLLSLYLGIKFFLRVYF